MPAAPPVPYLLNRLEDSLSLLGHISTSYSSYSVSWTTLFDLLDMLGEGGDVCKCLAGKIGLENGITGALALSSHHRFILTLL
jgi:hypothetical protein